MGEISRRAGELLVAAVLVLIGLVWIVESLRMPPGEFSVPGPGFFPTLLGLGLSGAALLLAGAAIRRTAAGRVRVGNSHIWFTALALLALAVAFEPLGFVPSIALLVAAFLRRLSRHSWTTCLLAGVGAAAVAYLFFARLLGIPLPPVRWL